MTGNLRACDLAVRRYLTDPVTVRANVEAATQGFAVNFCDLTVEGMRMFYGRVLKHLKVGSKQFKDSVEGKTERPTSNLRVGSLLALAAKLHISPHDVRDILYLFFVDF